MAAILPLPQCVKSIPLTPITASFLWDDVQEPLKGSLKCYNLLDAGVTLGQLDQQQQALQSDGAEGEWKNKC